MLTLLSPAKKVNFDIEGSKELSLSKPKFLAEAEKLAVFMRSKNAEQLQSMLGISEKIAKTVEEYYTTWEPEHDNWTKGEIIPVIYAFRGDVYQGFSADTCDLKKLQKSQNFLRIISGLYGVLKPLDLIRHYRLSMGTTINFGEFTTLYDYWQEKITGQIAEVLTKSGYRVIFNLASKEYAGVVDFKQLQKQFSDLQIIEPKFYEHRRPKSDKGKEGDKKLQMISFYAKKARGSLARFIVDNDIDNLEKLKGFSTDGYKFSARFTQHANEPIFMRES